MIKGPSKSKIEFILPLPALENLQQKKSVQQTSNLGRHSVQTQAIMKKTRLKDVFGRYC